MEYDAKTEDVYDDEDDVEHRCLYVYSRSATQMT